VASTGHKLLDLLTGVNIGGGRSQPRYIKRPFHTTAEMKRKAIKARNRRRHKLARPDMRARFGFLYASYREDTFYWDSVVLLRKLAIAAVAVFLRPAGAGLQACAAMVVAFVSLLLQTQVQPYANAGVNTLDASALLVEFATFFLAIVLYVSGSDDSLKQAVSLGIGLVNVGYVAYFFSVKCSIPTGIRVVPCVQELSPTVKNLRSEGPNCIVFYLKEIVEGIAVARGKYIGNENIERVVLDGNFSAYCVGTSFCGAANSLKCIQTGHIES
jgi:hypothetical protein